MQVPITQLSQVSRNAAQKVIKASKNTTIGQQIQMVSYYAFLHRSPKLDNLNFTKILAHK